MIKMALARHFILHRTDNIGDVVFVMSMAGILKSEFPGCKVSLVARNYTTPIAQCCQHLDAVYALDNIQKKAAADRVLWFKSLGADTVIHVHPHRLIAALARQASIPMRIGTSRRLFHWFTCNSLVHLHRRNSPLHEAQLNLKLLKPLGVRHTYSLAEIPAYYGLTRVPNLDQRSKLLIDPGRFNLIVHPRSGGTSREWPCEHFAELIKMLPREQFNFLITGSEKEGDSIRGCLPLHLPQVKYLTGKLSLAQLIALINAADGLVAASTGPLHIAAALGKHALGIYSPLRSKRASRWGPVGTHARVFQLDKNCAACRKSRVCACMRQIRPPQLEAYLLEIAARTRQPREALTAP